MIAIHNDGNWSEISKTVFEIFSISSIKEVMWPKDLDLVPLTVWDRQKRREPAENGKNR